MGLKGDTETRRHGDAEKTIEALPPATFFSRLRVSVSPRLTGLILLLIVAIVLLYGVIYPNLHVVLQSLQRDGNWSIQNYREILAQRIVLKAIFSSVAISILTVV